ncbi:MAG: cytochrome c3 family protein [Smithella sp.]
MHILRPLYVILALAAIILIARIFLVPDDFGIHEKGYTYGWYRKANIEEWKSVAVKYRGGEYCQACHMKQGGKIVSSPHKIIECENCHGPAIGHPSNPLKLSLDRSRSLCLRCHAYLPYLTSRRSEIKGIDPDRHNPGLECVICHNPHAASKPH